MHTDADAVVGLPSAWLWHRRPNALLTWPIGFPVPIWERATPVMQDLGLSINLFPLCYFCKEKEKIHQRATLLLRRVSSLYSRSKCASCDWLEANQNPIFALLAENPRWPCPQQTMFPQPQPHGGILISPLCAEISRIASACTRPRTQELLDQTLSPGPRCRSSKALCP